MASINKIVSKKVVGTLIKDGKSIAISAATETLDWKRTDSAANAAGATLKASLAAFSRPLPAGTQEICSRETTHKSASDPRDHITAVCFDANNKGTTIHVPVKK